ncbi:MAG: tripartite tricarboxylate transporter permease [Lachnospiraceae bacterium]|nr:tripartite tricarboxylate transporter permease [Lachnospiraceae bacterium]
MELILQVAQNIVHPLTLLVCFLGTLIGIVLGAIPGMNGGIGIAVMLPFTYSMSPAQGLLFLGGIYLGSSYGGSIAGILINCPGTAESACTTMEGYPMTVRGEGRHALFYSIIASGIGSLFGIITLIFFTPILSGISVKFGSAELFLLAICGLTIVGSLTGKNILKGMIAAAIGLFMAMIGIASDTGMIRFNFGLKALTGGVGLIPTVIGLFAIAEMIKQGQQVLRTDSRITKVELKKVSFVEILKKSCTKYKAVLLKSSVIGTLIGILPGTGGAIASFLAYGEAKAQDKEGTFGKGNPAGIIASESANNAAVGGSLVPMLSLGIPGSATSAIMFGALTIHGLVPGQRLFVEHADIAYTFLVGMLLTAVFMVLIGVLGIPLFSSILKVKIQVIIPAVILCSLIGAYSVNNSIYDVYIAVACGVLGLILSKLEIPTTPVVLGLILGNLIESNYIRTAKIAASRHTNLLIFIFRRPICIAIAVITVYLIYANIKAAKREKAIRETVTVDIPDEE